MRHQFLLELLCEEIPANALPPARLQLVQELTRELQDRGFSQGSQGNVKYGSTSRRLVVHLGGLPARQPDRTETVLGPPVRAAFSDDGSPTQAALGFARSQGVKLDDLQLVDGPKGRVVAAVRSVPGLSTPDVLAKVVQDVVPRLHFPKTMRWGDGEYSFVRPLHGIVALFGEATLDQVVPIELFGVKAGSVTVGHRVIAPEAIQLLGIAGVEEYEQRLQDAGVVIDPVARHAQLQAQAEALAGQVDCSVRADARLEGEHVELLEHPRVLRGDIAQRFLKLPEEVLVTTLRHHQKCLVLERDGGVAPYFLAVCDRADDPHGHVVTGNEWVAGARLADAEFFFNQDRKRSLGDHGQGLSRVVFHQKLGSYQDKTVAVVALCRRWLEGQGAMELWPALERAATLAKADLVTAMVGEFPELQGVVGGIYARLDGESEVVWQAVYDQYRPAGLDGEVPRGVVGAYLGVADRLDTLAGLFAAGELPTGSKDPFALRRAALAVVKICALAGLPLDLRAALEDALAGRSRHLAGAREQVLAALGDFLKERERHYLTTEVGVAGGTADAVLEARWGVVGDDVARARALDTVRGDQVFAQLALVFKRVRNIVAKSGAGRWEPECLVEAPERELTAAVGTVESDLDRSLAGGELERGFQELASLAEPLDRFFDDVLVMCDDEKLRAARLGLLARVEGLFLRLADLSRLSGQA